MLAHGPAHDKLSTQSLECKGPLVQILANLDIVWFVQKIVWLSLFDWILSMTYFTKSIYNIKP